MENELLDLDGNVVARGYSNNEDLFLVLTDTTAERTVRIEGPEAISTLLALCRKLLADQGEDDGESGIAED